MLSAVALGLAGFAYWDIRQRKSRGKALAIGGIVASILAALIALGMSPDAMSQ